MSQLMVNTVKPLLTTALTTRLSRYQYH